MRADMAKGNYPGVELEVTAVDRTVSAFDGWLPTIKFPAADASDVQALVQANAQLEGACEAVNEAPSYSTLLVAYHALSPAEKNDQQQLNKLAADVGLPAMTLPPIAG